MSKILWIDDDYEMIRGLIRPLEQTGHKIDCVRDITTALERLHHNELYELVIVDIIIPSFVSPGLLPSHIQYLLDEGLEGGEVLIKYIRRNLGLRIPIIVLSVTANEGELRKRFEPYLVSRFLEKSGLSPKQLKGIVEEVLAEVDLEKAVILNLVSTKHEEREAGLRSAARMTPSANLYKALVNFMELEANMELRKKCALILQEYPSSFEQHTNTEQDSETHHPGKPQPEGNPIPDNSINNQPAPTISNHDNPKHSSQGATNKQASQVLTLVLGVCGVAIVVIALSWWAKSFTPILILIVLVVIIVAVLGAMGILSSEQILQGFRDAFSFFRNPKASENEEKDRLSSKDGQDFS